MQIVGDHLRFPSGGLQFLYCKIKQRAVIRLEFQRTLFFQDHIIAGQKMEEDELPNLKFIRMDAEDIDKVFGKGEVDRIYLNFSDPWPKARHAKRRLTSREFLARYEEILEDDGVVEFKTDNKGLFEFSLEEVGEAGWKLLAHTFDLHNQADMREISG